jgi:hypothetical protein
VATRRLAKPRPVQGEQAPSTRPAEEPGKPHRRMVTRDRIRLTGLLRRKPWKRGFLYQVVLLGTRQGFGQAAVRRSLWNRSARAPGLCPATFRAAAPRLAAPAVVCGVTHVEPPSPTPDREGATPRLSGGVYERRAGRRGRALPRRTKAEGPPTTRNACAAGPQAGSRSRSCYSHPRAACAGESLGAIAHELNADRVPTAQGGRQWWPSTVRAVLVRHGRG